MKFIKSLLRVIAQSLPGPVRRWLRGYHGLSVWYQGKVLNYKPALAPTDAAGLVVYGAQADVKAAEWGARVARAGGSVTISIVCPVYNPNIALLAEAVNSVLGQSYKNWQLILVDDASTDAAVHEYLRSLDDSRIKVVFRPQNGHISAASNSGLAVATGAYIALLDQDDVLHKHALLAMADALLRHPNAALVYTDEDKLNAAGEFYQPHFKPDWSPDLFYSNNYVSHLGLYRADLVQQVGGFSVGLEGSQDYDLALKVIAKANWQDIVHLPYVLYHWRALPGSTAYAASEKSYTVAAGRRALQNHFKHNPSVSEVSLSELPNTYRVNFKVPMPAPLVDIIIPTRNQGDLLRGCVESILHKTDYPNYCITLVNNQSDDPHSLEILNRLAQHHKVKLLQYDKPFNYSAINNFAVTQTQGDIVLLLNNDTELITPGWLTEMVSLASRDYTGCVGPKLLYADNTLQHGGVILGVGGVANHSHLGFSDSHPGYFGRMTIRHNVAAVTGACLMVRREVWQQVGGLNDTQLTIAFNDVDFCIRVMQAGYYNVFTPYAKLYHYESKSRGKEDTPEKYQRFTREVEYMQATWPDVLANDPFYSPYLTRTTTDYSLSETL